MEGKQLKNDGGTEEVDLNRREAIKDCCLNCSGYDHKEVRDCTHIDCPLYPFRTGTGKQHPKERNRAIRAYCMWCTLDQPTEISLCPSTFCALYSFRGYNRTRKMPEFRKKTSRGRLCRQDFPEAIPEYHPVENKPVESLYMNKIEKSS
jgi:hypothetical protein